MLGMAVVLGRCNAAIQISVLSISFAFFYCHELRFFLLLSVKRVSLILNTKCNCGGISCDENRPIF